jgi:hypothetical protein
MIRTRYVQTFPLLLLLAGCSHTTGLLPRNEASLITEHEVLCLATRKIPDEAAAGALLLAPLVKAGAGALIDRVAGAIETESKLYKATYSARLPEKLFVVTPDGKIQLRFDEISFSRFAGDPKITSCADAQKAKPAMQFIVRVNPDPAEGNLRFTPQSFEYRQSRAKIAAWDSKLDINVQLQIVALTADKDGKKSSSDVARVDFPIGRVPIGTEHKAGPDQLKPLASGWFALPTFTKPSSGPFGAVTLMVTVMESDNLGDVLAKGAKSLRDDKEKLIEKLLERLDLKE